MFGVHPSLVTIPFTSKGFIYPIFSVSTFAVWTFFHVKQFKPKRKKKRWKRDAIKAIARNFRKVRASITLLNRVYMCLAKERWNNRMLTAYNNWNNGTNFLCAFRLRILFFFIGHHEGALTKNSLGILKSISSFERSNCRLHVLRTVYQQPTDSLGDWESEWIQQKCVRPLCALLILSFMSQFCHSTNDVRHFISFSTTFFFPSWASFFCCRRES